MIRSRSIYVDLSDDIHMHCGLGTFTMALYYAAQLDPIKGEKLVNTSIPERKYRLGVDYSGNAGGLTVDDYEAHFVPAEIQEVILFIENDLVSALNNESTGLIEQYGGVSNFIDLYDNSHDYLLHYGIYESEIFENDKGSWLANSMSEYKEMLQASLSANRPFKVWVR